MAANSKPRLQFDAITETVRPDPSNKQPLLFLQGYIGKSPSSDSVRVYADPSLNNFTDVPVADIVHAQKATGDPLGGSMLWVKFPTGKNKTATAYLEGNLYDDYLKNIYEQEVKKPGTTTIVQATDFTRVTGICATDFTKPAMTDFTKVLATDFTKVIRDAIWLRYTRVGTRGCPPWGLKEINDAGYYY
jgi:hypothetical protein